MGVEAKISATVDREAIRDLMRSSIMLSMFSKPSRAARLPIGLHPVEVTVRSGPRGRHSPVAGRSSPAEARFLPGTSLRPEIQLDNLASARGRTLAARSVDVRVRRDSCVSVLLSFPIFGCRQSFGASLALAAATRVLNLQSRFQS